MTVVDLPAAGIGLAAYVPVLVTSNADTLAPAAVVVPGPRPVFIAQVTVDTPGEQVEVQWSTDPSFPDAASGSALQDAPAGLDDAQVAVQATADIPDGLAWWRARIVGLYGVGPWSDPVQFGVDASEGVAQVGGAWQVDPAAPVVPYLWRFDPDRTSTVPGGTGVLVGTGFGAAPVVLLGSIPCTVVGNVADIPAGVLDIGNARTDQTAWHQEITFVIPAVDADHTGDAVTVTRED